jgi:hypothetical protein
MTKIKIVLAAVLFAATSSAALAQGNRVQHRHVHPQSAPVLQQRDVALPVEGRSADGPFWYNWGGPSSGGM